MKQDVNLAICGHAWHGKSTLVGKTVVELGMIGRRKLEQFERLARKGRDQSLVFALLMFRQKDVSDKGGEAARGITVVSSFVRFDFDSHRVTVIDTPGQETYTNNRFSGMFSSDCAMLVVDVVDGVQTITEQVLRILKGYEIPLVGVLVTKMDRVEFRQDAFDETAELIRMALQDYGLPDDVPFVPTSAYASQRPIMEPGEGITRISERMSWYEGPTFHKVLGTLDLRSIRPDRPLRVVIHSADVHEQVPGVGTAFTGLVESGRVVKDQTLFFEPVSAEAGEPVTAEVRSIELTKGHIATPGIPIQEGYPRQLLGVALRHVSTKELKEVVRGRGIVAGTEDEPPTVARQFEAEITVFDSNRDVKVGQQYIMHTHVDKVPVIVKAIMAQQLSPAQQIAATGEGEDASSLSTGGSDAAPVEGADSEVSQGAESIEPGAWARVRMEAQRPVAIEEADQLAPLSKLVLRHSNKPIAFGRCVRILK
ncbi:GTP-binding protein [Planctomycetota bacterium]